MSLVDQIAKLETVIANLERDRAAQEKEIKELREFVGLPVAEASTPLKGVVPTSDGFSADVGTNGAFVIKLIRKPGKQGPPIFLDGSGHGRAGRIYKARQFRNEAEASDEIRRLGQTGVRKIGIDIERMEVASANE